MIYFFWMGKSLKEMIEEALTQQAQQRHQKNLVGKAINLAQEHLTSYER